MRELVIDASVVLKWYLVDESCGQEARRLLDQHLAGNVAFVAPTILSYEVLNALLVAERMDRIAEDVTEKAFCGFLELEINFYDPSFACMDTLTLSRSYNRSIYDACYLSVAKRNNINFVTADKRLFNAVKNKLKWVKWLGKV